MAQPLPRPQCPWCHKFVSSRMNSLSDWLNRPDAPPGVREGTSRAANIDAFQFAHIFSKCVSPVNAPRLASGAAAMNVRSATGPSVALPRAISEANLAVIGRRVASACGRSSPTLNNSMYVAAASWLSAQLDTFSVAHGPVHAPRLVHSS